MLTDNKIENISVIYPNFQSNVDLEEILKKKDEKTYILNFSHEDNLNVKNCKKINVANNKYLLSRVMQLFFEYIPTDKDKIKFYFPNCEPSSISNVIYLYEKGYKTVNLLNYSPNSIRPTLKDFILKKYGNS